MQSCLSGWEGIPIVASVVRYEENWILFPAAPKQQDNAGTQGQCSVTPPLCSHCQADTPVPDRVSGQRWCVDIIHIKLWTYKDVSVTVRRRFQHIL